MIKPCNKLRQNELPQTDEDIYKKIWLLLLCLMAKTECFFHLRSEARKTHLLPHCHFFNIAVRIFKLKTKTNKQSQYYTFDLKHCLLPLCSRPNTSLLYNWKMLEPYRLGLMKVRSLDLFTGRSYSDPGSFPSSQHPELARPSLSPTSLTMYYDTTGSKLQTCWENIILWWSLQVLCPVNEN